MEIRCQHCLCGFDAPYRQLGLSFLCPHCKKDTVLSRESVISYRATGWEVSFLDFLPLVSLGKKTILSLLEKFGYKRTEQEPLLFQNAKGETLTPERVHLQIQNDAANQHDLYQTAMSIWR